MVFFYVRCIEVWWIVLGFKCVFGWFEVVKLNGKFSIIILVLIVVMFCIIGWCKNVMLFEYNEWFVWLNNVDIVYNFFK